MMRDEDSFLAELFLATLGALLEITEIRRFSRVVAAIRARAR